MSDDTTEENPFSFKRFVKNIPKEVRANVKDDKIPEILEQPSTVAQSSDKTTELTVIDDVPFPEVGETKKKSKGKVTKKGKNVESLKDLDSDNPFLFTNFVKKDAALKTGGRVLQIIDDEVCEVECNTKTDENVRKHDQLEIISGNVNYNKEYDKESRENGENSLAKLKEENERLKQQLQEMRKLKDLETARADSLVTKLRDMELKENEETAALEKMVQMVEKNLELTTQRAMKAEAVSVKLKEENRLLKSNSDTKIAYDNLVQKHNNDLLAIKEKASTISKNLETTAKHAEDSLRKLYSEADSLKLASQMLASIDKFCTIDEDRTKKKD